MHESDGQTERIINRSSKNGLIDQRIRTLDKVDIPGRAIVAASKQKLQFERLKIFVQQVKWTFRLCSFHARLEGYIQTAASIFSTQMVT